MKGEKVEEIENEATWKKVIQAFEERGGWIEDEDDLEENVAVEDRNVEDVLGMGMDMNDILGVVDDRDAKTDMAEGDIDDMVEADDDAELGMREGMRLTMKMNLLGAGR